MLEENVINDQLVAQVESDNGKHDNLDPVVIHFSDGVVNSYEELFKTNENQTLSTLSNLANKCSIQMGEIWNFYPILYIIRMTNLIIEWATKCGEIWASIFGITDLKYIDQMIENQTEQN